MHIGKNISSIRELMGIKQETLAQNLKVSQQTVSKIEQTTCLSDRTIDRIANALGVESSAILSYNAKAVLECVKAKSISRQQASYSLTEHPDLLHKIVELYERLILSEKEKSALISATYKSHAHGDKR